MGMGSVARMVLLEIDAQGSEGLTGLTKLRAEGITAVRKMSNGYEEDQVNDHKRQKGTEDSILLDQGKEQNEKNWYLLKFIKDKK